MTFFALALLLAADPVPPALRLGDAARPLRYEAELTIVPTEETLKGRIAIDVVAREPQSVLWLNAQNLAVSSAHAEVDGSRRPARVIPVPRDFVGLAFDPALPAGPSRVHLTYTGRISSRDPGGADRQKDGDDWYVFTQFEAIDARRVFPCFDEPSFKAPWKLAINVRKGDTALANAPAVAEEPLADGMKRVVFAESKPLPSYAVAFAVGPFDFVDAGRSRGGAPIRIVTPRGKAIEGRWAAEITPSLLQVMEDYFGSPYPYEKLDLIAVPLKNGAMENPGLITYGSRLLLSRPEADSVQRRRAFARVNAHELAHLWFGDLVTMAWWDDVWLNESFAAWMEARGVGTWRDDYRVAERRTMRRELSMNADALRSARKIRQPIESNDDIETAFDGAITYTKGSQVIRMFERWVGEDVFQRGVQKYLTTHAHGNATFADFMAAISSQAGRDIAPHFSTFLDQPGVPLVAMDLRCEAGKPPVVGLRQERFVPVGGETDTASVWHVPVCVRWGAGTESGRACTLLTTREGELPLDGARSCPDWLLPNEDSAGYYRAQLPLERVDALLSEASKALNLNERIGLIGDLNALARAGKVPYGEVLPRLARMARDPSPVVVSATVERVAELADLNLVPSGEEAAFARFIRETYGARAQELGWRPRDGEDDDMALLRAELVPLVADRGADPELRAQARKLADAWLEDRTAVAPELVDAVLLVAARGGDRALFDRWLGAARRERDVNERRRLIGALGAFRDPALLERGLSLALGDDFTPREAWWLVASYLMPPENRGVVYRFIKTNFEALTSRLPRDVASTFPLYAAAVCDEPVVGDMESFFRPHAGKHVGLPLRLEQSLERLRLCVALSRGQRPSIAQFLGRYAPDGSSSTNERLFQSK